MGATIPAGFNAVESPYSYRRIRSCPHLALSSGLGFVTPNEYLSPTIRHGDTKISVTKHQSIAPTETKHAVVSRVAVYKTILKV